MKFLFLFLILMLANTIYNLYQFSKTPQLDYEEFQKIKKDRGLFVLDVRAPNEFKNDRLYKAINIPLPKLKNAIGKNKIPKNSKVIVVCRNGGRSNKAALILQKAGYENVYNLTGGMAKIKS